MKNYERGLHLNVGSFFPTTS